MSLEKVTHIEGLDNAYEMGDLRDDTDPGAVLIKFYLESEEMPFLTEQTGEIVRKNFVWISKEWDLGKSRVQRRIRDRVEYDNTEKRWKVKVLSAGDSDIKRYSQEWNAFAKGTTDDVIGTPLMLLFKADPSRVEFYKSRHITTIQQLASLPQSSVDDLGMGAGDDVRKAKAYMAHMENEAPLTNLQARVQEKDQQIATLSDQVARLSDQMTNMLETMEPKKTAGRPNKAKIKKAEKEKTEMLEDLQSAKAQLIKESNKSLSETIEGLE